MKKTNKTKKKTSKRKPFFEFNKSKFTRKAVKFHNEVNNTTSELIIINIRIDRSLALCKRDIEILEKRSPYLFSKEHLQDFSDLQYHVENFCFRASIYRDKIAHFINQALEIGFTEQEADIAGKIKRHGVAKNALLDTELKKFTSNKSFIWALQKRKTMAHRMYYNSKDTGYHSLMIPQNDADNSKKSNKIFLKEWKSNIAKNAQLAEKFIIGALNLNDLVMSKINKYRKF